MDLIQLLMIWATLLIATEQQVEGKLQLHRYHNKMLYGHSYRNVSQRTMEQCLQDCIADCLCSSFQICDNECQLCSSTKTSGTAVLKSSERCDVFEFEIEEKEKIDNNRCDETCTTHFNCCLTSNPCQNGGTCIPSTRDSQNHVRFTCLCRSGYHGRLCEKAKDMAKEASTGNHNYKG